jgi:hypothetical protein
MQCAGRFVRGCCEYDGGMKRMMLGFLLVVVALPCTLCGQTASQPAATQAVPRAQLNKGEILRTVEAERRAINTLSVSFHSTSDEAGDERARYAARVDVRGHDVSGEVTRSGGGVAAGRQVMIDRNYGASDDHLFHQSIAFNGRFSCWYQEYNHLGGLLPGQIQNVDLRHEPFFRLNMLCDEARRDSVSDSASLAAFLRDRYTTMRTRLEKIDDTWCYVFDNGGWLHTDATLWLDPDRQFLPIRQKYFGTRKNDVTEWDVEKSEEIAGNGGKWWIATEGRELLPGGAVVHVSVDRAANGPAVRINEPLADDYFDLWKKMPVGTRVFNAQANRTFVVGDHGQLNDLAEGKELGGGDLSPDAHDTAVPVRLGRILAVAGVPMGFLVGSLLALAVVGWLGMQRNST